MKKKSRKEVNEISWTDNLEVSDELQTCMHNHFEDGICDDCGANFEEVYDAVYYANRIRDLEDENEEMDDV